eukprot:GFKZ01004199.1.p2 GENE.GFKZ01004199.1~~GFKZ01004199.1.p2  ORF type:complete len:188 (-),score=20.04 GFKZ01004199.1:948-1511(-)
MHVPPSPKSINAFVEYHTETANGRKKRMSGWNSEVDYRIFLSPVHKMLSTMPRSESQQTKHSRRSTTGRVWAWMRGEVRTGVSSLSPMEDVEDDVVKDQELDSGPKAPAQGMLNQAEVSNAEAIHSGASVGDLGDISADLGANFRLSKSEPEFEPLPEKTFVFKTSDWAEAVGIEQPPCRSGGQAEV